MNNKSKKDLKNELRESLLRMDELETQLDTEIKVRAYYEKQNQIQKQVIQQLRQYRDNCIEFSEYQVLKENIDKLSLKLTESEEKIEVLNKKLINELNENECLS